MWTIVCCKNLCGIWPLSSENLHIIYIGVESSVAHSFNITAGNIYGPPAEHVGISLIALVKSASLNYISSIVFFGTSSDIFIFVFSDGSLKTSLYCVCKMSAISLGSEVNVPCLFLRGPTLHFTLLFRLAWA